MTELLELVKGYAGPVNTLFLGGILYFMREMRGDIRDVRINHLPHILERLGKLEGAQEERRA